MAKEIVPAHEWQRRLARNELRERQEKREFERKRQLELSVEDLRDTAVSLIRNEVGDDYEKIHERGGAHPSTLKAWETGAVRRPQMPTLRASLRAIGKDLGIVDYIPRRH